MHFGMKYSLRMLEVKEICDSISCVSVNSFSVCNAVSCFLVLYFQYLMWLMVQESYQSPHIRRRRICRFITQQADANEKLMYCQMQSAELNSYEHKQHKPHGSIQ